MEAGTEGAAAAGAALAAAGSATTGRGLTRRRRKARSALTGEVLRGTAQTSIRKSEAMPASPDE